MNPNISNLLIFLSPREFEIKAKKMVFKKYNVLSAILEYIKINNGNYNYHELIDPSNDSIKAMSFKLNIFPSILCLYIKRNKDEVINTLNSCISMKYENQSTQDKNAVLVPTSTPEKGIVIDNKLNSDESVSPIQKMSNGSALSFEIGAIDYKEVTINSLELSNDLHLSDPIVKELIPFGSTNHIRRNRKILSYKNCVVFEGKFDIPDTHKKYLFEKSTDNNYMNYYLRNRIRKYVNNTCSLAIKDKKILKNGDILILAYCIHNKRNCKKFRMRVESKKFVTVCSSSKDYYHEKLVTTYVKGHERFRAKKKLLL